MKTAQLLKEAEADAMVAGRFYHVPTNPSEERAVITQYLRISNMMHHKVKARLGLYMSVTRRNRGGGKL